MAFFITWTEILDVFVMSVGVGFIFSGIFGQLFKQQMFVIQNNLNIRPREIKNKFLRNITKFFTILTDKKNKKRKKKTTYSNIGEFERYRLNINKDVQKINPFLISLIITAPAIILHELGHKFVAMAFGLGATFHAAYNWLLFAVFLRLVHFPFLFFVPAYVSITGTTTPASMALIAFAGPAINLVIWGMARLIYQFVYIENPIADLSFKIIMKINLFLFILNMLPIPGFDGWKVYSGLIELIKGAIGAL